MQRGVGGPVVEQEGWGIEKDGVGVGLQSILIRNKSLLHFSSGDLLKPLRRGGTPSLHASTFKPQTHVVRPHPVTAVNTPGLKC